MSFSTMTRLLFCALALTLVQGCVQKSQNGEVEGAFYERPDESRDIISDDSLAALEEGGFTVNDGTNPPDISGSYYIDSHTIVYDDEDIVFQTLNYTYTFEDAASDGEVSISYETDNQQDVGDGLGAFISGKGDCFTLYIDASGTSSQCTDGDYKQAQLISGCISPDGIEDWQLGLVMLDRAPSCDALIEPGHRRVIEETDGMADRVTQ